MPDPFQTSGATLDLAPRYFRSGTVVASPADANEVVVAQINIGDDLAVAEGVALAFWMTLTVGTAGVSILTRIRRDSLTGTVIKASGAETATAAQLVQRSIAGFDTTPTLPNEVYVVTVAVASATAASTITALEFSALVI